MEIAARVWHAGAAEVAEVRKMAVGQEALDRIDRNILRQLQADGSIKNTDLAERVNLSPAACLRRVERLREKGFIRKFVALVDPAKIELVTLAYVGVVLDRSTPQSFADFEEAATKIRGCLECHLVAGEFDYIMLIRTKNIESFNRLHAEQIISLPSVRQIRTFFVLKEILSTTQLPI